MKRNTLSLIVFVLVPITAGAQKIELKINAGANVSLLPDFENQISIVDGFVTPGIISINNARNPPVVTKTTSETKAGVGFTVEAEAGKRLTGNWKLSVSLGVSQISYDYDSHISQSFFKNNFNLSEVYNEYGDTRFTYLTCRPLNVSKTFSRFSVQAGAILNYLISKKNTNTVVLYNVGSLETLGAFFEQKGEPQQLLFGAHANARFAIAKKLELMLGGQYFFNSLYGADGTYGPLRDKGKALQVLLGLSYSFVGGFRK